MEKELAAAADLTLKDMEEFKAVGMNVHEAWQAARELHLILPEEPNPDDEMPENPAWDAMVLVNKAFREQED